MSQPHHHQPASPPTSTPATRSSTPLSLSLTSIPPLITPSPPSNTLLITNLNSPHTFTPSTLQTLHALLSAPVPLNSFSPLPSLHRLIVSYPTTSAAIDMRKALDGTAFGADDQIKLYFGEHTPVQGEEDEGDRHLHPPSLGKLLFISPPPSPPMGWEIREEEPPNRDVHAEDLQRALAGLNGFTRDDDDGEEEREEGMSEEEKESLEQFRHGGWGSGGGGGRERRGTGSLMVYNPGDHGGRGDLPKVMVEDTEGEGVREEGGGKMLTHTARPPVELMGDA